MTKKTLHRKRNSRINVFDLGGSTDISNVRLGTGGVGGSVGMQGSGGIVNTLSGGQKLQASLGLGTGNLGSVISGGLLSGIASGISSAINPSGNNTNVGNTMQTIGSLASNIPGVGGLIGAGVNLAGGLINTMFGSNINDEFVGQTEDSIKQQSGYTSTASDNSQLLADWSSYRNMEHVSQDDVGSDGWFSDKAKNLTKDLNNQIDEANLRAMVSLGNTASNIKENTLNTALRNFTAYGGPLTMRYTGTMSPFGNQFDEGGNKKNTNKVWTSEDINNPVYSKKKPLSIKEQKKIFIDEPKIKSAQAFNKAAQIAFGIARLHPTYGIGMNIIDAANDLKNKDFNNYMSNVTGAMAKATYNSSKYTPKTKFNYKKLRNKLGNSVLGGMGILMGVQDYINDAKGLYDTLTTPVNEFSTGGSIHIKPENRGKFTALKKRTGKSASWFKEHGTPAQKKMATFALNARKWKHDDGGFLTHGGIFSNGVTEVNSGGTHEQNPYEGVQLGVDNQGIPNLVEEGEVIWNDYVFSNRLKPSKDMKRKNKYKGNTFADIAKSIQKESEERPNDPISKRGLEANMSKLAEIQEGIRERKNSNNKFDIGGNLRYAPILGHGIGVIGDLFSEPDYTAADTVSDVEINPALVSYTPVGNYLSYTPLDKNFYINKLNADSASTRRAIGNTSGGNRAAAMAGLLAADYNYGNQLGILARQAEEYNQQLRERVEGFNRQTNLANSEMGLKAGMANAESRNKATQLRLSKAGTVAAMRQAALDAYNTRRSNNINVLLDELGGLGTEETYKNWLDNLANAGVLRMDSKGNYIAPITETKARGGKIKTKKKKGYTYG